MNKKILFAIGVVALVAFALIALSKGFSFVRKFGGVGFPSSGQANFSASYRTNSAGNSTSTIKEGPGSLHLVVVGSQSAGGMALYDSVTTTANKIAEFSTGATNTSILYDIRFQNGLFVSSTAGSASSNVTIVYN